KKSPLGRIELCWRKMRANVFAACRPENSPALTVPSGRSCQLGLDAETLENGMKLPRTNSREKILAAAADVAAEAGPGSLSLDAVALRAGVSKGGLLYNFPTKAKRMQGLVERYLSEF